VQAQASLTLILASLAPFTLTWYASTDAYAPAVLMNAAMFGLASLAAQLVLRRLYEPLIARNPRHRTLLRAWLVLYAFIGIQLGWVLRPFIGHPGSEVRFFRQGAWGNAYIEVWHLIGQAM
jgi:branched-subunit amino acid ABC-type transport system permease component